MFPTFPSTSGLAGGKATRSLHLISEKICSTFLHFLRRTPAQPTNPTLAVPSSDCSFNSSDSLTESSTGVPQPKDPSLYIPKWSPKLFRRSTMLLFGAFLVFLIIGLEMLHRYSPYRAPSSSMLFMWTYIPVALLMGVEWIWTAYDVQIKVLIPWAEMSTGFSPAEKSWLLDYIGANYFIALWTAFKNRHLIVLLMTAGLWSTAIAGIVSSSLFQLQDIRYNNTANFNLTRTLNRSSFDPSILVDNSYLNSYLGRRFLGLALPQWTTPERIVMEGFNQSSLGATSDTLMATTRGFAANLSCTGAVADGGSVMVDPGKRLPGIVPNGKQKRTAGPIGPPIGGDPGQDPGHPEMWEFLVNITAAGCQIRYPLTRSPDALSPDQSFYFGRLYNHTCPDSTTSTTIVIMASVLNDTITGTSAVQCSPTYFQHLVSVSVPPAPSLTLETLVIPGTTQEFAVAGWQDMLLGMNSTLPTSADEAINAGVNFNLQDDLFAGWGDAILNWQTCDCDPWFFLVGHGQSLNAADLMHPGILSNATAGLFTEVWSDLAERLLFTPAPPSTKIAGRIQGSRFQLVSRSKSIRVAQAALIFLIIGLVVVYRIRPRPDLPINPSSLIAHAFLLRRSHDTISEIVKDTPIMSEEQTKVALRDWNFRVENCEHFLITCERQQEASPPGVENLRMESAWRPPILHPIFKLSLALIIVGSILSLEFALRYSASHHGFGSSTGQDWWTYVASGYLFVLGIFLSSYAFSISTLEPLLTMHRSSQPALKSLRYSPAHRTTISLAFHSFKYRNPVGFFCAILTLTIPFLKIVVSGLTTSISIPVQTSTYLSLSNTFNTTAFSGFESEVTSYDLNTPAQTLALSQIERYQLRLPAWTTPEGAVGQFDVLRLPQTANNTLVVPLPVIHAELTNCTALVGADLIILPSHELQLPHPATTNDSFGFETCVFNGAPYDGTETASLDLPQSPGWFGRLISPSCGGYVFVYGNTDSQNASEINAVTAVQCLSYSLTISTQNVTLVYDGDAVKILGIDSSTSVNTTEVSDFQGAALANSLPQTPFEADPSLSFDAFMQIMTLHNTSTPLDAFLDPAKLMAATQRLFAVYWASYADRNMRIPMNESETYPGPEVTMAQVIGSQTRIIQATVPTRLLQGLFSLIIVCGVFTAIAVPKTNHVLKKHPYSIGTSMSLLVDSTLLELEEFRWVLNDAGIDKILKQYKAQLGWGNNPYGGIRFGVDVVSE